eukprot:TRINITY_DN913_c0_g1_i1.p2 TRINITY_DN913_c0_g1~~TRINITY_DN913_c0_g1_i1.p2  ORF type:complete len:102 (+),score=9.54 TRINITY_DN913_c0_g1_i1:61-366(+)
MSFSGRLLRGVVRGATRVNKSSATEKLLKIKNVAPAPFRQAPMVTRSVMGAMACMSNSSLMGSSTSGFSGGLAALLCSESSESDLETSSTSSSSRIYMDIG